MQVLEDLNAYNTNRVIRRERVIFLTEKCLCYRHMGEEAMGPGWGSPKGPGEACPWPPAGPPGARLGAKGPGGERERRAREMSVFDSKLELELHTTQGAPSSISGLP